MCEVKVNEIAAQRNVFGLGCVIHEHFLMEYNLTRIIDWNLLVDLQVHAAEVMRSALDLALGRLSSTWDGTALLVSSNLFVDSHYHLVTIDVDVSLHQWHGLVFQIKTGTEQVNIQDLMITYNAEYSLVVVLCLLREEFNDNSDL